MLKADRIIGVFRQPTFIDKQVKMFVAVKSGAAYQLHTYTYEQKTSGSDIITYIGKKDITSWAGGMSDDCTMFTNGIEVFNQAYKEGLFDYILATNLNYLRPELRQQPWFIEVDMSKYIALIIATLNHDRSISPLLNPMQRIQNLLARHRAAQIESDQK